jgi:hypothetical protein
MTWDIVDFLMPALGNLPERKVLGEVHCFVDFHFHFAFVTLLPVTTQAV